MKYDVFEDENNLVIYQEGQTDYVLITFNHMGKLGRRAFWGQDVAEKLGISCIGIVPKKPHWYPYSSIQTMLPLLLEKLTPYKERITYGFSMGAYAALKYSNALNATNVLAFSPQYSIDPKIVGDFDERYSEHFVDKYHSGMGIYNGDCIDNAMIFVDDDFSIDMKYASFIKKNSNSDVIFIKGVGHQTINAVSNSERLLTMLDVVKQDSIRRIEIMQNHCNKWSLKIDI